MQKQIGFTSVLVNHTSKRFAKNMTHEIFCFRKALFFLIVIYVNMYWFYYFFSVDTEQMFITDLVRNRFHRILNYSLGITLSINIEKLF